MTTDEGQLTPKNVVLAVGSTPKGLDYEGLTEIPVEVALDPEKLDPEKLDPEKLAEEDLDGATVAVFGSSHSTMIALPNLLDTPVGKINASSGILAPGQFGIGIAYPHYKLDPLGAGQFRVGLEKFMRDLNKLLPIWRRYSTECVG